MAGRVESGDGALALLRARAGRHLPLATAALLAALALAFPAGASAAKLCQEPGSGDWQEASPAEAGMDAERLAEAIDYATQNSALAVRVYRHGCRVGEDDAEPANRTQQFESWSMAKSATALVFMRAMTLGHIGPDDPLGSLITEADRPHGAITIRDLLTMTSGLKWNGFRDYNIFMPDRIREALAVEVEKRPGTYWEYSQSGPALLAEAVARATGEDFQDFAQRELFGPLGIEAGSWFWRRDSAGHTQGFFGLNMRPDDFARLGELLRRGGAWRGERIIARRLVREAIKPVPQSGCYGWLIWLNESKPCVGPRIENRPVDDHRMFPSLPVDLYQYSGLFGQRVTVLPDQGLLVVRIGNEDSDWEEEFYRQVLNAVVDDEVRFPPPREDAAEVSREDVDRGFAEAFADPEQYLQPITPPPLAPAGPARARATLINFRIRRPTADGEAKVRLSCPERWNPTLTARCEGKAKLVRAGRRVRYEIAAGAKEDIRLPIRRRILERLDARGRLELTAKTRNSDADVGAVAKRDFILAARR